MTSISFISFQRTFIVVVRRSLTERCDTAPGCDVCRAYILILKKIVVIEKIIKTSTLSCSDCNYCHEQSTLHHCAIHQCSRHLLTKSTSSQHNTISDLLTIHLFLQRCFLSTVFAILMLACDSRRLCLIPIAVVCAPRT